MAVTMSVTYLNFAGQMVGEVRGGVVTDYVPDTLGSVIATVATGGTVTSTSDYMPYGEPVNQTGTNPSPFGFVGTLGYFTDSLKMLYVRARYLRVDRTTWMTVDPLWPKEKAYEYVDQSPLLVSDESGLQGRPCFYGNYCGPCLGEGGPPVDEVDRCCASHDKCLGSPIDWLFSCYRAGCDCVFASCVLAARLKCFALSDWECFYGSIFVQAYASNSCALNLALCSLISPFSTLILGEIGVGKSLSCGKSLLA